jgi:AraC-like DNA-binding protein
LIKVKLLILKGPDCNKAAFDAGFGDLSHFNRAFRARYGTRPSDVRAAAQTLVCEDRDGAPAWK